MQRTIWLGVLVFSLLAKPLCAAVIDATWDLGGSGNWNTPANWDIGVVPNNGANQYNVRIDNDSGSNVIVLLNLSSNINNLTIDAGDELSFPNNIDLGVAGSVINDGIISLNSTGSLTDIVLQNPVTILSGSGTLFLGGNLNNRVIGSAGTNELINTATHTIAGGGQLGGSSLKLTNQGLIDANDASGDVLFVNPNAAGLINTGSLQASGGGRLRLEDGTIDGTGGGLIHAADGSFVELGNNGLILGGTITTAGTGRIQVPNNLDPIIAGSITNNGQWEMNSTGSLTDMRVDAAATLTGTGTLTMIGNVNNRIFGLASGAVLTNESGHTIAGQGQLGANFLGVVNQGTVDANNASGALLIINPDAAGLINTGTLQASDGGRLRLEDGTIDGTGGGVIHAGDGSFVELGSNGRIFGGTFTTAGTGRIQVPNDLDPLIAGAITNNGQWEMNSTGSLTDMRVDEAATLGGSGTLTLVGSQLNRIFGLTDTAVLTNMAGHTIAGQGQIGVSFMGVVNEGTIDANDALGALLTIDPSASGVINTGTLQASGGGRLRLQGGTYDSTGGGLIHAAAGSFVELGTDGRIEGGTMTTSDSGRIQVPNNLDPIITGTITNNGQWEMNSTGSLTDMRVDVASTLTGNGILTLVGSQNNRIFGLTPGSLLTNEINHTIAGQGQLGANFNLGLVNRGLIDANDATGALLTIDPSDALVVTNTGTLQANGGGRLRLQGGTYDNTGGGMLHAANGSFVELGTDGRIVGGTFTTAGSGRIQVPNNLDPIIVGTITNNGQWEMNSTGSLTDMRVDGATTLQGIGKLTMLGSQNNRIFGLTSGSVLTNENGHTIAGQGQIGINFNLDLINKGLIDASAAAALTIDPSTDVVNDSTGILRGSGTAGLQLVGGTFDNQGTVEALNGSNVTYSTTAITANNLAGVLTGGIWRSISTDSAATVTLRGNNITQIAANTEVELSGAASVLRVATTPLESTLTTNAGTLRIADSRTFTTTNALNNTGMIDLGGATLASGVSITNDASGAISGNGQIDGTLVNHGSLEGDSATEFLEINGTVSGGGAMQDVRIDGTHIVGSAGGTAIVPLAGSYRLNDAMSHLRIDLGGATPGAEHDQLSSTGTVALAGNLDVTYVDLGISYVASIGDRFTIITSANPITGTFDTVNLPFAGGRAALAWLVDDSDPNEIVLEITAVDFYSADFDHDGDVDGRDFLVWQRGGSPDPLSAKDLAEWREEYGNTGGPVLSSVFVPEPSTWALTLLMSVSIEARRIRRFLS